MTHYSPEDEQTISLTLNGSPSVLLTVNKGLCIGLGQCTSTAVLKIDSSSNLEFFDVGLLTAVFPIVKSISVTLNDRREISAMAESLFGNFLGRETLVTSPS